MPSFLSSCHYSDLAYIPCHITCNWNHHGSYPLKWRKHITSKQSCGMKYLVITDYICLWCRLPTQPSPWSRVIQKVIGLQIVKKFPAFYRPWRFITGFTTATTCPYPEPNQSNPSPHAPSWRSMCQISCTFSFNYVIPNDEPKSEALESVLNMEKLYGEKLLAPRRPPSWTATPY